MFEGCYNLGGRNEPRCVTIIPARFQDDLITRPALQRVQLQALSIMESGVRSNEMRLSCGANWTISQTDGLHSKTAPSATGAC